MTDDRADYLRVEQHYGELLADFRRRKADIAAEYDAKITGWRRVQQERAEVADERSHADFDDEDFSNNTWLL